MSQDQKARRRRLGAVVGRSIKLNEKATRLMEQASMIKADSRRARDRTRTAIALSRALRRIRGGR